MTDTPCLDQVAVEAPSLQPVGIAVSGVDFGWGSAGKLSAILAECVRLRPNLRVIVIGTSLGRGVLMGQDPEAWYDEWPSDRAQVSELIARHNISAGLVVLDPEMASRFETAQCPTVFIDSLPYLWTSADPLPFDVTAYCAQLCPELPWPSWEPLRRVDRLTWVQGIAAYGAAGARDTNRAVLNLGGLHSPANPHGNPTYVDLVLRPALAALARSGFEIVDICGNVTAADLPRGFADLGMAVTAGSYRHADFLAKLGRAGLVLTSPGLTTLLEASAVESPTVCLPPQNLSQILNGHRFALATNPACFVEWPSTVLNLESVESARLYGEEVGLRAMNDALAQQDPERIHPILQSSIEQAITHASQFVDWFSLARESGLGGARQVAQILLRIATAAGPLGNDVA